MSAVLSQLYRHARRNGGGCALGGDRRDISYTALVEEIEQNRRVLQRSHARIVGLALDNGPAWAVWDLAVIAAGLTCVPLPAFFSDQQTRHVLADAGVDTLITDQPERFTDAFTIGSRVSAHTDTPGRGHGLWYLQRRVDDQPALDHIAKITYTSGTTGTPKGVLLSQATIDRVALSLATATACSASEHHLSLLPLATLLENIGGIYVPLLAGACCHLQSLQSVGVQGASGIDVEQTYRALQQTGATRCILIPQMLQSLVEYIETQQGSLPALAFVAVGGAPVASQLLQRADAAGLPVYQGYGLSECASVVAVNTRRAQRPGSVGKPLPHVRVDFADDGEVLIGGASFAGYLGGEANDDLFVSTGDVGHLDADGFLYVTGRKKNIFITSFGRNVAPEWIEGELVLAPSIDQAAVFGETRPFNVAVVVMAEHATPFEVDQAMAAINQSLPDYARIGRWLFAEAPFSVANGQLTNTGRLRRSLIGKQYATAIEQLYQTDPLNTGGAHGILRSTG